MMRAGAGPSDAANQIAYQDPILRLRATCLRQLDVFDRVARRRGLSGTQLFAIRAAVAEGAISSRGLCEVLAINDGAGSRMIETLVLAGLLRRDRLAGDRRVRIIAATRAGIELAEGSERELTEALVLGRDLFSDSSGRGCVGRK